jgi:mannose/fructose/N-acetylgalactosamine-specific phosphotransferase system component IID
MKPFARAVMRLLVLQASWTYERLQGIGMGYASLPLLEPLRADPERYRAAVARATEFFNAHPYLAGIAVGAAARAEQDHGDEAAIRRVKTALSGPLGSLGDQLFWVGVVPAVLGSLLVGVALGVGVAGVVIGVMIYVAVRIAVTAWGLRVGYAWGLDVPSALKRSGLQEQIRRVGFVAAFAVGVALPLVVAWHARPELVWLPRMAAVATIGGIASGLARRRLPPARRLTLLAIAAVLLWRWSLG